MTACPVHGTAQNVGRPSSESYRIVHRIADRFEPQVAEAFVAAMQRLTGEISDEALAAALRAGEIARIESTIGVSTFRSRLEQVFTQGGPAAPPTILARLVRTFTASGTTGAEVLSDYLGVSVQFNAVDADAVIYARTQVGRLVVQVSDDVRATIRGIVAAGQEYGLPIRTQARLIHQTVGLPPNWSRAPANLAREIREGQAAAATSRRLSAVDKARIRSRIARGTVDDAFVREMSERYTHSLRRRRGLNIARTETMDAANTGQRESWRQAARDGQLPRTARRDVVVTPDERLRVSHAEVPGMNPNGVGLDEPFDTPWGALMGPPWEPLCRCSETLRFSSGRVL
jgi:hypothetical protein